MLSHISIEELLDVVDFFDSTVLVDLLPRLDDGNLLKLHKVISFPKLPIEVQPKLQSHLMTRSLNIIQQLDKDECFDRQQLYMMAVVTGRTDIMEYVLMVNQQ